MSDRPKFTIPPNVKNDTHHSTEAIVRHLEQNGLMIKYGDFGVVVQPFDYEKVKTQVGEMAVEKRQDIMRSVDRALRKSIPKVAKGTISKKAADNLYADLMLWQALKEIGAMT